MTDLSNVALRVILRHSLGDSDDSVFCGSESSSSDSDRDVICHPGSCGLLKQKIITLSNGWLQSILLLQGFDVGNELVDVGFVEAIVDAADMSVLIDEEEVFGVQELIFGAVEAAVFFGKVELAPKVVDGFSLTREQQPFVGVDALQLPVFMEHTHTVHFRGYGMGE